MPATCAGSPLEHCRLSMARPALPNRRGPRRRRRQRRPCARRTPRKKTQGGRRSRCFSGVKMCAFPIALQQQWRPQIHLETGTVGGATAARFTEKDDLRRSILGFPKTVHPIAKHKRCACACAFLWDLPYSEPPKIVYFLAWAGHGLPAGAAAAARPRRAHLRALPQDVRTPRARMRTRMRMPAAVPCRTERAPG